ncbi:MAG: hypothetical protein KDC92_15820 [Bacteroidetes bacterium]|nr:hypothetical protein [Bacteroidota bacterium]
MKSYIILLIFTISISSVLGQVKNGGFEENFNIDDQIPCGNLTSIWNPFDNGVTDWN